MKRLISTFACMLALLIWTCTPAQARFLGTLQQNVPWTLEVNTTSTCGAIAVTVTFVNSRGRQDIDLFTLQPGGGTVYGAANIPRNTRRIIIEVDLPCSFDVGFVTVQQSTNIIDRDFCGAGVQDSCADRRFVFDVVEAP